VIAVFGFACDFGMKNGPLAFVEYVGDYPCLNQCGLRWKRAGETDGLFAMQHERPFNIFTKMGKCPDTDIFDKGKGAGTTQKLGNTLSPPGAFS